MKARQVDAKDTAEEEEAGLQKKKSRRRLLAVLLTKQRHAALVLIKKPEAPAHIDTQVAGEMWTVHRTVCTVCFMQTQCEKSH